RLRRKSANSALHEPSPRRPKSGLTTHRAAGPCGRRASGALRSDDDRDGSAVRTPRRASHVRRAVGAEEDDHGGDLVGLRKSPERTSGAYLGEDLVAIALLLGEPALTEPGLRRGRAGRDRI